MNELHWIDGAILIVYLLVTVGIGFWISKRASKNLRSYFLGGNQIPWYMLGLSNASGMFDISGTIWLVYLLMVYGVHSVWIPWLWPVFNQIFLMVYLSVWLRRSGVVTGAQWIRFRFGDSQGAKLAHMIVVVFALVSVVGFLAYGFVGVGKFAAEFLPQIVEHPTDFESIADPAALNDALADKAWNEKAWGLIITALTTLYVVKGGMYSVVFTEVLQYSIMTVASLWIGWIAICRVSPEMLAASVPEGWDRLWFGWRLDSDWSGLLEGANAKIASDGYELFAIFFALMVFKGILGSMAGPAPNYDMQRILSARTPKEAAYMSGFVSLVLFVPRYVLIAGVAVLALALMSGELNAQGAGVDYDNVLAMVIDRYAPVGLFGLLVAALLAAFMSTYAATVNAAPAYVVNDIYKRYINPDASDKTYVRMSYAVSIAVVLIGTLLGLSLTGVNQIVNWIVSALFGGYTVANVMKWHWWRFNSYGYFWGMLGGMAPALYFAWHYQGESVLYGLEKNLALFPVLLAASLLGCVAGSLLTEADDREVLKNFYRRVRPWGFWGPIHEEVLAEHPGLVPNRNFPRDAFNVLVGVAWQTSLVAIGIYLVLQDYTAVGWATGVAVVSMLVLKFNWYDKLEDYPADLGPAELASIGEGEETTAGLVTDSGPQPEGAV
ncbi:Sodium/glucose cotransporter [Pseudobythopirellula maris]|uniref:Sodium/glucose cotransporter n=1 Tax=Pseudobythopirellula maris TaxID=2527991 RepID=A0A5C5ZJ10_9BACT|nr:sodium:solute symporter family protein [Pseudobythopirellula maris]TWT87354.1 Sodium/glucose cotransporter [Pseudobythopirellula maris]